MLSDEIIDGGDLTITRTLDQESATTLIKDSTSSTTTTVIDDTVGV